MTDWHIDAELLDRYEHGELDTSRVMAVDAHMLGCARCRGRVRIDASWVQDNWAVVFDTVHAPRPSRVERLLNRVGLPEHRVRLLAVTPALRWAWLAATAAVLGFAVAAAYLAQDRAETVAHLFLVLAPILPVLAVSTAFGPPADPMHEITGTTAMAGPGLVLWRSMSVIGVATVMAAIAAVLLPGPGWFAVAWLLPALLLCIGTLALATALPLPVAAGVLGALWLIGVLTTVVVETAFTAPLIFGPAAQSGYLVAAVLAAAVLIRRRSRFDLGESR